MTDASLSPRARAILEAVEREIAARTPPPPPSRGLRLDSTLVTALELAVGGASRAEVGASLRVGEAVLDAVFGDGTPPHARLSRRS